MAKMTEKEISEAGKSWSSPFQRQECWDLMELAKFSEMTAHKVRRTTSRTAALPHQASGSQAKRTTGRTPYSFFQISQENTSWILLRKHFKSQWVPTFSFKSKQTTWKQENTSESFSWHSKHNTIIIIFSTPWKNILALYSLIILCHQTLI